MAYWTRAVVVGASSGIGEAIARQLAGEGSRVVLVARREELLNQIAAEINHGGKQLTEVFTCDVRDVAACEATFKSILDAGPIDCIVYSSGIMPEGTNGTVPTGEDVNAIETNLMGAVAWLNAAATYMKERGSGTIVGISSVAGERGRRANPVYSATKSALSSYLESLRYRLNRRGVKVVTVKPGPVRTPMLGDRKPPLTPTADEAAARIIAGAQKGKRLVWVPPYWAVAARMLKLLPPFVMERLNGI